MRYSPWGLLLSILALSASAVRAQPAPSAPASAGAGVSGDVRSALGPPRARPLSGAALEQEATEVAKLLRCPVCQGLSVADSPSTMATQMRVQVRELVAAGYDRDQVLANFERSYGEFVRLEPPLRGVNWLVWLAPIALLAGGAFVVARVLGRARPAETAGSEEADLPGRDTLPEDSGLARYVLRVREQAYGWPEGRPPAGDKPA